MSYINYDAKPILDYLDITFRFQKLEFAPKHVAKYHKLRIFDDWNSGDIRLLVKEPRVVVYGNGLSYNERTLLYKGIVNGPYNNLSKSLGLEWFKKCSLAISYLKKYNPELFCGYKRTSIPMYNSTRHIMGARLLQRNWKLLKQQKEVRKAAAATRIQSRVRGMRTRKYALFRNKAITTRRVRPIIMGWRRASSGRLRRLS